MNLITINRLTPEQIADVLIIQRLCYGPELNESAAAFLRKQALFPEGCLGAWDNGRLCGYVFSHPWKTGKTVQLESASDTVPADADCLYIHDLAVAPSHRKQKVGRSILSELFKTAAQKGWMQFALVAVQESEGFWSRWGFEPVRDFEYAPGVKATHMLCRGIPRING